VDIRTRKSGSNQAFLWRRIGGHHFLRSVHNSWQSNREGQSATRLALDPDAANHLTEGRLMATPRPVPLYWAPWQKFGKIPGTVHSPAQPPPRKPRRQTA
jgi:hypothetical protein